MQHFILYSSGPFQKDFGVGDDSETLMLWSNQFEGFVCHNTLWGIFTKFSDL